MTKKVNLRKASAIQKEIGNYLQENQIQTSVSVPLLTTEAEAIIIKARNEQFDRYNTTMKLNEVLYAIRDAVSKANADSGISSLLSQEAEIKSSMRTLDKIKNANVAPSNAVLESMIQQATGSSSSDEYYGSRRRSNLDVDVLTEETIASAKKIIIDLKRKRSKINEQVLALNVKTEIEINDDSYSLLKELGIV